MPRLEGGNIVVALDDEDYLNGVEELKYIVVGRDTIQKGELALTTLVVKRTLEEEMRM